MKNFYNVFHSNKTIIGMIHLDALPGTPNNKLNVKEIIQNALKEACIYKDSGIDALAIENMHDIPYLNSYVGHEISSLMAIIGYEIKNKTNLTCGIQILAGANKEAIGVANSAGLDFIRAEGYVFSHIADEGLMNSCAGELLRYRKNINAENILIFTDIKKKHSSHSITSDVDIVETAKAAEYFQSNGLIITGVSTGQEADLNEIKNVKKSVNIPVIVGSGVNNSNLSKYLEVCDAFIIGSYFKKEGYWKNPLEPDKIKNFMKKVNSLR